ncbi:MAG: Na(+)-translocating NADH-quinone reductase subunit A [Bacteroidales bacterium]|nr:Na(+)-translocating NADH-quinone reductase subunit A [Bacteroidales bacterium]
MPQVYKTRKGLNINLKGKAEKIFVKADKSEFYAVKPNDFHLLVPKLEVKEGDPVKAGSVLFHDKSNPGIRFTSPVSGVVSSINRGERRVIQEVVIRSSQDQEYVHFSQGNPAEMDRNAIVTNILGSGLWPVIKQRPYNIIANPAQTPKSIFISAFDTAPLAPDYDFLIKGSENEFQYGIDVLARLTTGKVHINISDEYPASLAYSGARNAKVNYFRGPHPAGNVGVQIHRIDPVNKGEVVWSIAPQEVIMIGRLFMSGIYDASKVVALTGSEVLKARYYKLISGACVKSITENNITDGCHRHISGNVLTGTQIEPNGFLGYYDSQVTIIPEGTQSTFLGWAMPGFKKFSLSRTFFSWLAPGREYCVNTNLNGGPRAFVATGVYEKVLPMKIYPMQLFKAILSEDIDLMEKLGIYEIAEEDVALCEYVCPSKTEIQALVRKGLDLMIKEMS